MSLSEKIEQVEFYGYEKYIVKDFLVLNSLGIELGEVSVTDSIKSFIKVFFVDEFIYSIREYDSNGILFFYSHDYYREDHLKTFQRFTSIINTGQVIYPTKKKRRVSLILGIRRLLKSIHWIRNIKQVKLSFQEKITLLSVLQQVHDFRRVLSTLVHSNQQYKLLVVYFDLNPLDNFLVQHFKYLGVKTSTLQHGVFIAGDTSLNSLENYGVELKLSSADYFLAWNRMTLDEALKANLDIRKFKLLGIPKYINSNIKLKNEAKSHTFGVVLGTESSRIQNLHLIELANELSYKLNYKFKLKYHPTFKMDEYDAYLGEYCVGVFDKYMSIQDYSDSVDFTIVGNSSVYIELIFLKHPTYRISTEGIFDKYHAVDGKKIISFNDLIERIESNTSKTTEDLFEYLCTSYEIYQNYMDFFSEFLNT